MKLFYNIFVALSNFIWEDGHLGPKHVMELTASVEI
jgi:hypothetical protein